ncbi:MAG: DNA gyrase C-terminal beta-propeller domain-containing protein, partial [Nanoarchaeota archaeon]|nr:DNA gyrase C-terminal beta-propeller domain-containing protein [Nanoarchaeota archaeon]
IKQLPLTEYKQQRRGGKGVIGTGTKEEDVVRDVFITNNHNTLLFFTNKGKIHWLPAYDIPEGSRYAKGKALVNVLALQQGENVSTILPIQDYNQGTLFFATKQGTVKRTELKEFSNPRKGGILAINLEEKDELISALLTDGNKEIIIASKQGQAVRFNETAVRSMGRQAGGVRGISLDTNDEVIGAEAAQTGSTILTITEQGYGKRTPVEDYRLTNRGGSGVINIKITEKNGPVAAILTTYEDDELICMTNNGQVIRIAAKDVSIIGRNTQGVRIMKVEEDKVTTVAKVGKD